VLSALRCRVSYDATRNPSAPASTTAKAGQHYNALPLRLQRRVQRVAKPVGQGVGWCQEALLLPDCRKGLPFGVAATFRPSAEWPPWRAGHWPLRL